MVSRKKICLHFYFQLVCQQILLTHYGWLIVPRLGVNVVMPHIDHQVESQQRQTHLTKGTKSIELLRDYDH